MTLAGTTRMAGCIALLLTILPDFSIAASGSSPQGSQVASTLICQTIPGTEQQVPAYAEILGQYSPAGPTTFTLDSSLAGLAESEGYSFKVVKEFPRSSAAQRRVTALAAASSAGSISNTDVKLSLDSSGAFTMQRTSDNAWLLYPSASTTAVTVKVDETAFWTRGSSMTVSQPLQTDSVAGTASIEYLLSHVRAVHRFELAGPAVRFSMRLTNEDIQPHKALVRYLFDTQVGPNDGAPLSAPGIVDSQGSSVVTYETDIPLVRFAEWKDYDIWPSPTVTGVGTVETVPTRMVFAHWPEAINTPFDYAPQPSRRFYTPGSTSSPSSDSCVLVYFDCGTLGPGQSVTVTTAYGLGIPTGGTHETRRQRLVAALTNLREALRSYHDGCIRQVAAGDAPLAKNIAKRADLWHAAKSFGLDLVAGGSLAKITGKLLTNSVSEITKTWVLKQVGKISFRLALAAEKAYLANHADDWYGEGDNKLDYNWTDTRAAEYIEGYLAGNLQNVFRRADDALANAINNLPAAVPDSVPLDSMLQQIYGIRSKLLELTPAPGRVAEQDVFWALPGSCSFDSFGNLDPVLLGVSSNVAATLRLQSTLTEIEGTITEVRQYFCAGWVIGGAVVKGISALTVAGALPGEALYWGVIGGCGVAGNINAGVDVVAEFNAVWQEFVGINSLDSDVEMTTEFFQKVLAGVAQVVSAPGSCSSLLTASDLNIPDINVGLFDDHADVTADVTIANTGATPGAARAMLQVFRKSNNAYDELICLASNGSDLVIGAGSTSQAVFVTEVPIGGLLWPGRYLAKVTVVSSAGVFSRSAYFRVCQGPACWIDDTWSRLTSGSIQAGQSVNANATIPAGAQEAEFTLSHQGSDMDLHLYDPSGHHVGVNYATGVVENQIPGAVYSGPSALSETIRVPTSSGTQYTVRVVGVSTAGQEDYSVLQTNLSGHLATLATSTASLSTAARRGGNAQLQFQLREVGQQQALTGIAVQITDLTGPAGVISSAGVTVNVPQNTLAAGTSMEIALQVPLSAALQLGTYSGTVTVLSSTGQTNLAAYVQVIEPRQLIVAKVGPGTVTPFEGVQLFNDGDRVTLTATPAEGYAVSSWSGTDTVSADKLTAAVVMNADRTVTVEFADQCPDDPNKASPDVCGCGVPDTDTDGDGTPDCLDKCLGDPNKTEIGACGCGVPDTDTDGDGMPDCLDKCPGDPNKTEIGACGCGQTDLSCATVNLRVHCAPEREAGDPAPMAYKLGETVTLMAPEPPAGYHFDHWEGDASGTDNPISVVMDKDKTLTAVYAIDETPAVVPACGAGACGAGAAELGILFAFWPPWRRHARRA